MKDRKIKVGDYARCGSAGIKKVIEVRKHALTFEPYDFIDHKGLLVNMKYVQKYSSNPLELIELGDCINGRIVTQEYFIDNILYRDSYNNKQYDKLIKLKINELKSFITREQLEKDAFIF